MASSAAAAIAATGSSSDASDDEADAARFYSRRRSNSPSTTPSRSKIASPDLRPSATAPSSAPTPAGSGVAAASDPDAVREGSARDQLDADAGADTGRRAPSTIPFRLGRGELSISHSDSDATAGGGGREPSPRRSRERTARLHADSDNSAATATVIITSSEDDGGGAGDASLSPDALETSYIKASAIKPIRTRLMDLPGRDAAKSYELRTRSRPSPSGFGEHQKRASRVWSPEDEVTILSALIEYRAKKGRLPGSFQDTNEMYFQIHGRLTANVSTTQLSDKVRRLKHKYKLLVNRAKSGRDPNLPMEHDRNVYELSKKVWSLKSLEGSSRAHEDAGGAESNEEREIRESDEDMENERGHHSEYKSKKRKTSGFEIGDGNATFTAGWASRSNNSGRDEAEKLKQKYPYLWAAVEELSKENPSGPIFRKALAALEKSKSRAIEEKLRKFRMSVIRLHLNRMDLTKLSVGMVLDVLEGA
ncbi:hypothetical protein HU200_006533 [Digitaria exilis]|uniref:Glabrous enhancer-binding protein-like DBD domain-containing protein n=1 Tax=Digitaria exilis TaxID=1010633 RepID=A0A835FPC1_9POAL|nr:hypothetical protein HU200_006533 [Digitaria exilis]CAB3483215.1 unnamed protein product [Digitaria exilis]